MFEKTYNKVCSFTTEKMSAYILNSQVPHLSTQLPAALFAAQEKEQ